MKIVKGIMLLVAMTALVTTPVVAGDASDNAGRIKVWTKAFNSGDVSAIAAGYTEDAVRMPYQMPAVTGRDAIVENIEAARAAGAASAKITLDEGESSGDHAWGRGRYELMDGDGNVIQTGKWLNVSKKVKGQWLIHRDIWNTDKPEVEQE
ncbi:MAG: DUF4440 domain-containing protein [Acidobacteriota bacterium]|nr:DUF4440 domain-containing protein [Acidobacteriota bacterium]